MNKVKRNLNDLDLRITSQRRVILDELERADSHLTADEVYDKVRRRLPRVSLGTVYRNLEILCTHGLLKKLETTGHQRLFESNTDDHHHICCVQCGKLIDVPAKMVKVDTESLNANGEFEIVGFRLELMGKCLQCDSVKKAR